MACGNLFNSFGRRGMCGCGRRNNYYPGYPGAGFAAPVSNRNSFNNNCGCRKHETFVDYMPVVVDYTVTPMNYNVIGVPDPVRGYAGANNYVSEAAVIDDILDDGVINGSNRRYGRYGRCGCGR